MRKRRDDSGGWETENRGPCPFGLAAALWLTLFAMLLHWREVWRDIAE